MGKTGLGTISSSPGIDTANLDMAADDINRFIDRVQNAGNKRIAKILREIGQAVFTDSRLEKEARRTTIEILRALSWEASLPPAKRRLEIVKVAFTLVCVLPDTGLDVLNSFDAHLEELKKFFGIPK
jgi:hypothetical protein